MDEPEGVNWDNVAKKYLSPKPILQPDGTILDNEGQLIASVRRPGRARGFSMPPRERPVAPRGPTCRWFGPSRDQAPALFAEAGPDWPYDQLFERHGCGNPQNNRAGITECRYYQDFTQCNLYEEAPVQLLQARRNPETGTVIRLRATRLGLGQPRYQIVSQTGESDEVLLHNLDNVDHNGFATDVATSLFDKAVEEAGATEIIRIESDRSSYLSSLKATHAATV